MTTNSSMSKQETLNETYFQSMCSVNPTGFLFVSGLLLLLWGFTHLLSLN